MKQIIKIAVLAAVLTGLLLCALPAAAQENELVVFAVAGTLNNGDGNGAYADDTLNVNDAFAAWYAQTAGQTVTVAPTWFATEDELYAALAAGQTADVVLVRDTTAARLAAENRLASIDTAAVAGWETVDEAYRTADGAVTALPYAAGYWGLAYNTEKVMGAVNRWDVLWNEDFAGAVIMPADNSAAFAVAMLKNDFDLTSADVRRWEAAAADLQAQQSLLLACRPEERVAKMAAGEGALAACTYGEYLTMAARADESVPLAFGTVSGQTGLRYTRMLCLPANSQNAALATAYCAFLYTPRAMVANANYTGEAAVVRDLAGLASDTHYHFAADPAVYPSDSMLANCRTFPYPGAHLQGVIDAYTPAATGLPVWVWPVAGAVVVLAAVLIVLALRRKAKRR